MGAELLEEVDARTSSTPPHPGAEPRDARGRRIEVDVPAQSKRSIRPPSEWVALVVGAGKWAAGVSAPFLAAGALWLYTAVETEKARAAKLQAEADAIRDARELLANDVRKLRDCVQKHTTWSIDADRMYRAVLGKLGAGVQGANYKEVEFKPAPLAKAVKRDAAPPVQPVEALPPSPTCDELNASAQPPR
jgi:hypothetical protein